MKIITTILGLFLVLSLNAQYSKDTTIYYDPWDTFKAEDFPYLLDRSYDFSNTELRKRKGIPEPVKIIFVFVGSIALEAIGDGFYDDGKKFAGHAFSAAATGLLFASPFILNVDKKKWPLYFASYIGFRIALFDPVYNGTRGLPISQIGSTSYWDKGLQEFNPPSGAQLFGRAVILTFSISITIKELK